MAVCLGTWFGLAQAMKVKPLQRGIAATLVPVAAMGLFLWLEGSPFNGVIAFIFLPPAMLVCAIAVLMLERFVAARLG